MRPAALLVAYAVVVCALTWPLAGRLTTHLPHRSQDDLLVAWVLAEESSALVHAPTRFGDANIYHPTPHALFYGEVALAALPHFLPPFLLTGNPALALNLTFLGGVTATAWALHLVVASITGVELAGVIAGWTLLTTPWLVRTWAAIAPNYAILQYLPVVMLLAMRPALDRRGTVLLGLALVVQGLASPYLAVAVLVPVTTIAAARLGRTSSRAAGVRLGIVVVGAALVLCAAYAGYLRLRADNPALAAQTWWSLAAYHRVHLPFGPFVDSSSPLAVAPACFAVIALGFVSRRWRTGAEDPQRIAWMHGALWAVLGLALSLGREGTWDGRDVVLPHGALERVVPLLGLLRQPIRLGVVGLFGVALLTALGFAELARRVDERCRHTGVRRIAGPLGAAAIVALMYRRDGARLVAALSPGERVRVASAFSEATRAPATDGPIMEVLRRPGGPLLEVPIGPGPQPQAEAMYRSIVHRRALLNGYHGYWPAAFPVRMEMACRLPEPAAVETLRQLTGLELVLVHGGDRVGLEGGGTPPYGCRPPAPRADAWAALAATGGRDDLRLIARDGDDLLFAVEPPGERR